MQEWKNIISFYLCLHQKAVRTVFVQFECTVRFNYINYQIKLFRLIKPYSLNDQGCIPLTINFRTSDQLYQRKFDLQDFLWIVFCGAKSNCAVCYTIRIRTLFLNKRRSCWSIISFLSYNNMHSSCPL